MTERVGMVSPQERIYIYIYSVYLYFYIFSEIVTGAIRGTFFFGHF